MSDSLAITIGYWTIVTIVPVVLLIAMAALWGCVAVFGRFVWKKLRRLYHLNALWYWLRRLEREGTHAFQRPDNDDSA